MCNPIVSDNGKFKEIEDSSLRHFVLLHGWQEEILDFACHSLFVANLNNAPASSVNLQLVDLDLAFWTTDS